MPRDDAIQQPPVQESTELIVAEKLVPAEVFKPDGTKPLIDKIEKAVAEFVPDISTDKGRKEVASFAHKIARSKTLLDGMGKELNAGLRLQINAVDEERRKVRERLDELKTKVRAPLTKWEEAEEERKKAILARISEIAVIGEVAPDADSAAIKEALDKLFAVKVDDTFAEFKADAALAKDQTLEKLRNAEFVARAREEQARIERERAEAEAREREERERLAREEAERQERERQEREAAEAAARAEQEAKEAAERAEREAAEAEERRQKEEAARLEAERKREEEHKAELDRVRQEEERKAIEAQEQAEREKLEAAERARAEERERIAAENERRRIEADRRAADQAHRGEVNRKAALAIGRAGNLDADAAKKVVIAIVNGEIPAVSISY